QGDADGESFAKTSRRMNVSSAAMIVVVFIAGAIPVVAAMDMTSTVAMADVPMTMIGALAPAVYVRHAARPPRL
ncbi:hypothetical protein, partial [Serratia ureilytica]|uniref:hypothetical protein n=1 Tax=Serratia ureilytica TaxID=300181 RepID=UPI00235F5CD7